MNDIEEIYRSLTNVDIVQQQVLWDERGKGYYGEYLVFRELYFNLPGTCKLLMNLNIPTPSGKTTEIDLLLIHETGVYVFEIKHYKGTIYGKPHEPTWTQYFRTAQNHTFRNPVGQNRYHIHALRDKCPGLPIRSYIVFTSSECDLKVDCNDPDLSICTLSVLSDRLSMHTAQPAVMDTEQINRLFCALLPYSPLTQQSVRIDEKEIPFYDYISILSDDYKAKVGQLEADYQAKAAKEQKECQSKVLKAEVNAQYECMKAQNRIRITVGLAVVCCLLCIVCCIMVCGKYKKDCAQQVLDIQQQMNLLSGEFGSEDGYNGNNVPKAYDLVSITDYSLYAVEDAVSFSCTLRRNDSEYGISIGEDAVLIMVLRDGTIKQCPMFSEQYPYSSDFRLGKSNSGGYQTYYEVVITPPKFYNVAIGDVVSIKLSNIYVWHDVQNQPVDILQTEVELFRAT